MLSAQRFRLCRKALEIRNDVVSSDVHHLNTTLLLPCRSAEVHLASSDLLHMYLALAGICCNCFIYYMRYHSCANSSRSTGCLACRMVHSTDIVEFELRSKKFSLAVRKKEALEVPEPVYMPVRT